VESSCPEISVLAKCATEWDILGTPVTTTGETSFSSQSQVSSPGF